MWKNLVWNFATQFFLVYLIAGVVFDATKWFFARFTPGTTLTTNELLQTSNHVKLFCVNPIFVRSKKLCTFVQFPGRGKDPAEMYF
jgi:hypothetical protein